MQIFLWCKSDLERNLSFFASEYRIIYWIFSILKWKLSRISFAINFDGRIPWIHFALATRRIRRISVRKRGVRRLLFRAEIYERIWATPTGCRLHFVQRNFQNSPQSISVRFEGLYVDCVSICNAQCTFLVLLSHSVSELFDRMGGSHSWLSRTFAVFVLFCFPDFVKYSTNMIKATAKAFNDLLLLYINIVSGTFLHLA